MKKLSTREVSTALFLSSYKTAKLVTENEDIFPKPATMEDYEKLMLYALAMFVVHDEVHDKLLNDKIIYDATMDIYTSILKMRYFLRMKFMIWQKIQMLFLMTF